MDFRALAVYLYWFDEGDAYVRTDSWWDDEVFDAPAPYVNLQGEGVVVLMLVLEGLPPL